MTLQLIHSEFPYGKFYFLFYQCIWLWYQAVASTRWSARPVHHLEPQATPPTLSPFLSGFISDLIIIRSKLLSLKKSHIYRIQSYLTCTYLVYPASMRNCAYLILKEDSYCTDLKSIFMWLTVLTCVVMFDQRLRFNIQINVKKELSNIIVRNFVIYKLFGSSLYLLEELWY